MRISKIPYWLLIGLIITYVLGLMLAANILLGLFLITSLWALGDVNSFKSALTDIKVWCLIIPFLLTAIGLLHSEDLGSGLKYLEMRAAIFLLPWPLYFLRLSKREFDVILITFVVCCLIAMFIGLTSAFINYLESSDSGFFYNNWLVYPVNNQAVYFSIYINLSIVFVVYQMQNGLLQSKKWRLTGVIVILFLLVFNFLLASRLSLVIIFLMGFVYLLYWIITERRYKVGLGLLGSVLILIFIMAIAMPKTVKRFKSIANTSYSFENMRAENHFNKEISPENWNGLTLRLAIWTCALEVVEKHPIVGVGTGDYSKELEGAYESKGFQYAIEKDYGIHNQYLYFLFINGTVGLVIFLLSMLLPTYLAIVEKNWLYILFMILIACAFLTENILNKYTGIVFFSLMSGLLLFRKKES